MSDSLSLYDTLFPVIRKAQPHEDARRLRIFVWAVVGLLVEKTISLLVMSVAYLHLVSLGTFVVAHGLRESVDGHWVRGLSYFQIGWRWLRRSLYLDRPLLRLFRLLPGPDPQPVPVCRARRTLPVWTSWSLDCPVT